MGHFQVGYANGAVGYFIPHRGFLDVHVLGSEGTAYSLDNGLMFEIRRSTGSNPDDVTTRKLYPEGETPTVNTIRDLINSLETGEPTRGNIDVTMQSVEVQFAIAHSHLAGGARVEVPVADRSLYIPGG